MKHVVCALAMIILAGSSCKSKAEPEIAKEPEIVKENPVPQQPAPENHPTKPSDDHHHHHGSDKCDECDKCHHKEKCHHHGHHKHKKIPPGHAKKMHGDKSARKYAPGHNH